MRVREGKFALCPAIIIVLHLCLTVFLADRLNLWIDEAYTVNTTGQTAEFAYQQATHFELQPPLYFVALEVWRQASSSFFFARLFSVTCAATSLLVLVQLARKIMPQMNTGLIVAAAAFNPFMIWAASEVRVYALVMLLSSILLQTFLLGYVEEQPRPRARVAYIVTAVAALYTQYFLSVLLIANSCFLIMFRRSLVRIHAVHLMLIAALFTPSMMFLSEQMHAAIRGGQRAEVLSTNLRMAMSNLLHLIIPSYGNKFIAWGMVGVVGFAFALRFTGNSPWFNRRTALPVETVMVASICLVVIASVANQLLFIRYFAGLFIPVLLSLFVCLPQEKRRLIFSTVCATLVVVTGLFWIANHYRPLAKAGDWERVASFIQHHESKGQPILVFWAYAKLPFMDYYSGVNTVRALPAEPNLETYDVQAAELHSSKRIEQLAAGARTVWLVNTDYCGTPSVDLHCALLERDVASHYRTISKRVFFHNTVRLLRSR